MSNAIKPQGVACSIFRKEIEWLIDAGRLNMHFRFVDSELHMNPQKLDLELAKELNPGCLLCFGECHGRIVQQEQLGKIDRVFGLNCIEIFLGRETYRRHRKEGAFFLLPERTMKWERVFKELLGFNNQTLATQFMTEMHSKLIYINTGVIEIPVVELSAIAQYFSLPVEIIDIDLIHFENAIKTGIKRLQNEV